MELRSLEFVPGHLKIERICDEAFEIFLFTLWHVSDQYKTQEICDKAVEEYPGLFYKEKTGIKTVKGTKKLLVVMKAKKKRFVHTSH